MSIDLQFYEPFLFDYFKAFAAFDAVCRDCWETGLLRLQSYPLDTATFVVSDYLYVPTLHTKLHDLHQYDEFQSRHRWTVKEKMGLAE